MIRADRLASRIVACCVGLTAGGLARAADVPAQSSAVPILARNSGLSVRAGVFVHDPLSPERGSTDLTAQILLPKAFRLNDPVLDALIPRASFGGTGSLSNRTSHAYAGVAWTFDLTPRLFVEGTLGLGINNGEGGIVGPNRNPLGCNWNFYENLSLGYRLGGGWVATATLEHISNAGLCKANRGLTNFGARIGYEF
jgi:hypothetical protein